jgi:hypothetical protein
MTKPIWGLQAEVASKTEPLSGHDFICELIDLAVETLSIASPARLAAKVVIAAFRYANGVGLDVEEEVRRLLNGK